MNKRSQAIFLLFMLSSIGMFSLIAVNKSSDIRSKAYDDKTIPIPSIVPPSTQLLNAPYLRVFVPTQEAKLGDKFPIVFVMHPKGQKTAEARMVFSYDPLLVALDTTSLAGSDVYPVLNTEESTPGKLTFSVFGKEENDYQPVAANKEEIIGTVYARIIGKGKPIATFTLAPPSGDAGSGIYVKSTNEGDTVNILSSVENASVTIH
jgi:hypothetical protein